MNYNAREVPQIQSIEVKCSLPQGQTVREVRVCTPDAEASQTLTFRAEGTAVSFVIPQVRTYSLVSVSW